jgi:hypothetical protein
MVSITIMVSWKMMLCSLVNKNQHSVIPCILISSSFFWKIYCLLLGTSTLKDGGSIW